MHESLLTNTCSAGTHRFARVRKNWVTRHTSFLTGQCKEIGDCSFLASYLSHRRRGSQFHGEPLHSLRRLDHEKLS